MFRDPWFSKCVLVFSFLTVSCIDFSNPFRMDEASQESTLEGFTQPEPEWSGPALSPRKNYDLQAELKTFFSCQTCKISADSVVQRQMIAESNTTDFFIWVVRLDGQLVLGTGPDELMSHGVVASLNLTTPVKTVDPMASIFAGGEGYYDPKTHTLFVSNKSGHYRPDFSRVANATVTHLFSKLFDKKPKIEFQDRSKRRTEVF